MKRFFSFLTGVCVAVIVATVPACGQQLPSQEQMRSMLPDLTEKIQSNPKDVQSLSLRGFIYQQLGNPTNAVADFTQALDAAPTSEEALHCYNFRLTAYMQLKDFPHALTDASAAIKLKPDAMAYSNRGAVYLYLKQLADAIKDDSKALQLNPSYGPAYDGLGEAAYKLGKYQDSIAYCNRALYLDPRNLDALYFRGKSYEALGKKMLAQKDLESARSRGFKPDQPFIMTEK